MPNPVRSAFIYLMHLAWKSRLHIPFLLTVCFLVFDIRLQLEVNINMTRRQVPRLIAGDNDNNDNYAVNNPDFNMDDINENDDDDEDDEEEEEDDSNDDYVNRVIIEECKPMNAHDIEKITNLIYILSSLRVPLRKYNDSSDIIIIRPSVFHHLSNALEKHYNKKRFSFVRNCTGPVRDVSVS